jgi:hypothetical protein
MKKMSHSHEPLGPRTARDELLDDARHESERVAAFLSAVESSYATPPAAGVEERHMAAILAAVHGRPAVVPLASRRGAVRRWRGLAVIAAAIVMSLGLLTGLSYAGVVTLPSPVRAAFGAIGIHLPEPARAQPADEAPGNGATVAPAAQPTTAATPTIGPPPSLPGQAQGDERSAEARGDNPTRRSGDVPDRKGGDTPTDPGDECDLPTLLCGI